MITGDHAGLNKLSPTAKIMNLYSGRAKVIMMGRRENALLTVLERGGGGYGDIDNDEGLNQLNEEKCGTKVNNDKTVDMPVTTDTK